MIRAEESDLISLICKKSYQKSKCDHDELENVNLNTLSTLLDGKAEHANTHGWPNGNWFQVPRKIQT